MVLIRLRQLIGHRQRMSIPVLLAACRDDLITFRRNTGQGRRRDPVCATCLEYEAGRLAPDFRREGLIMWAADFDQIVEQTLRRIPARFRSRMQNVAMVVEDEPSPSQRGRIPYASTLLGLYEGRPLTYRGVPEGFQLANQITIFQGPHERMARNPADPEP